MSNLVSGSPSEGRGNDLSRRSAFLGLAVVTVLALALRLYGLNWDDGFSWTPHPDERAIMFRVAELSFPGLSDLSLLLDADESPWNPGWFPYGSFPLYLLKIIGSVSAFFVDIDPNDLRVVGRVVSALADVAVVILVYAMGATSRSRIVGLLASAFVAISVIHIQLSHFFAVDTLMALLCVATIFFLVRVARFGRLRDSILAGLFLGLGLATKNSVAPILAAFLVAHIIAALGLSGSDERMDTPITDRIARVSGNALFGILAAVVAFVVAQPYALLDWAQFSADFTEQSEMVRRIRDYPYTRQYIDTTPYFYHVQQLSVWGLGLPLGVVAWFGTVYAAVKGLRPLWALGYLVFGALAPAAILVFTGVSMIGIVLSAAFSVGALLITLPARSADARLTAVALSWVVPYFLITGAFDVKFMRYLIPVTPFMLLFGAEMLIDSWRAIARRAGRVKLPALAAFGSIGAVAFALTLLYAVSYLAIYSGTHPAVRAAEWVSANAPRDSLMLREHWDEGIPGLGGYEWLDLELYNPDTQSKLAELSDQLASADYILIYSNRLYGTIPRLPDRYPVTREYYRLLFQGNLGYALAAHFESHPNLFGVAILDDTFSRPDLPAPAGLVESDTSNMTLNFGFADESFSVYDHPKLLLFYNAGRFDSDTIYDRVLESSGGFPTAQIAIPESPQSRGLMLSPGQLEDRRSGGTWTDIINADRGSDWLSILIWLIAAEAIALIVFPLSFYVFRPLEDKGWLFSKGLGPLMLGLVVWLLSSLELMPFARMTVYAAAGSLIALNAALLVFKFDEIGSFFRRHWRAVLSAEFIFLAAFAAFVLVRMANPDLWHPYRGGEKPMDMAYLNAVLKSTFMPPYDPWFGGGYINYYYWGQFLVGMLIHATGIAPEIAINLAIPLFFAMTFSFSYSVVYNLACAARSGGNMIGRAPPAVAGLLGGLFVATLGNLDGAIQLIQGAGRAIIERSPMGEFDFWRSSRMMPPDPPGHEITEFPFFTFLFADPHAHLWSLPFTILCVGIAAAAFFSLASRSRRASLSEELVRIVVLGIAIGALRLLNTWDYPTYLLLGGVAVALGEYMAQGGFSSLMLLRSGAKAALIFLVGYVAFLPYNLNYETFFSSVERTTNTTPLWQFLAISGLFAFIIVSFCLWQLRVSIASVLAGVRPRVGDLIDTLAERDADRESAPRTRMGAGASIASILGALAAGYLLTALVSGYGAGGTIIFGIALLGLLSLVALRSLAVPDGAAPATLFSSLLACAAIAIVVGLDIVRVEGDIERMNSVFKFYLQVWVLLALASAFMLWRLLRSSMFAGSGPWRYRYVWAECLAILLVGASIYPILGTQDRLRDRFDGNVTPLTLDGLAYMRGVTYNEPEGPIDLEADFEGIEWLRWNVAGSPVVLEANTPTYRWGGRVSIHTGLPSVVGWQWHQEQQRWGYRDAVALRIRDVERIYSTEDASVAMDLLRKYGVKYIYVGQLEKSYYPSQGIAKFEDSLDPYLGKAFDSDSVSIYEVLD